MFGTVEILVAILTLMISLLSLFGFWIRRLYKEIDDLKQKADPELKILFKHTQQELEDAKREIGILNAKLLAEHQTALDNHGKVVSLSHQLETLREKLAAAKARADKNAAIANKNGEVANRNAEVARKQISRVKQIQEKLARELQKQQAVIDGLKKERGDLIEAREADGKKIIELDDKLATTRKRDQTILNPRSRIWERPVPESAPPFVPLAERRAPIISVLNLKGGVGKTTLTANLAATWGHPDHGVRTLVLDLDYQRSLTSLCMKFSRLNQLHAKEECAQHFFLRQSSPNASEINGGRPDSLSRHLLNSVAEVRRGTGGEAIFDVLACSESYDSEQVSSSLDDTEMHLFAQWLLRARESDIRFQLREALHTNPIQSEYQYILIDCPPRFSLACLNALAASDFVLVPIIPDITSVRSIYLLLKKLDRLRLVQGLMSHLKVLGIVANRAQYHAGNLLQYQYAAWDQIPRLCREARRGTPFADEEVHAFEAMIPQLSAFGNVIWGEHIDFAVSGSREVRSYFSTLFTEMEERIHHERASLAAVSGQSH